MVTNVPDYCIAEVADHTLALMLTCLRKTSYLSQAVKSGVWDLNFSPADTAAWHADRGPAGAGQYRSGRRGADAGIRHGCHGL